jgi:hypothetical protein
MVHPGKTATEALMSPDERFRYFQKFIRKFITLAAKPPFLI